MRRYAVYRAWGRTGTVSGKDKIETFGSRAGAMDAFAQVGRCDPLVFPTFAGNSRENSSSLDIPVVAIDYLVSSHVGDGLC